MILKTPKILLYGLLIAVFSSTIMLVSADSAGSQEPGLSYSTFVGTASWDGAEAITVDSSGRAYIVAQTESTTGFPGTSTNPLGAAHEVNMAVFRLNPEGTDLEYAIYFNPSADVENEDYGYDIVVDSQGSAYVVGQADKPDLCSFMGVVPGYDPSYNGGVDAFVMKIKPDGSGLEYCTFIGGAEWETAYSLKLDQNNNAFLAGYTWSADFPVTSGAYDESINGARDIFVARLSADGTDLTYATFMGGSGQETATALALDSQNNAYVTGWTTSNDLPTPTSVIDNAFNGPFDGFLFKLNAAGSNLIYNTYIGGSDEDRGRDVILNDQGEIFVIGNTRSEDFTTTPGAFDNTFGGGSCFFMNCSDGFVLKLNNSATSEQFATYIGGDSEDLVYGISLAPNGSLFITGESISANDFPTTPDGYDPTSNGEGDGYLLHLNAAGTAVIYGTYLGSTDVDRGIDLWTDGESTVYLTGQTLSTDFPTIPGSYDTGHNGDYDIFVSKLILPPPPEVFQSFVSAVFRH
jgi:hypothetical protein